MLFTDLLSLEQVLTEYPALTERHLQTLRASGALAFYLVRGRAHYSRSDIEGYLAGCRTIRPRAGTGRKKVTA